MSLARGLAAALAAPAPAMPEQDEWRLPVAEYRAAAVLIAITERPAPGVLLTLRHAGLSRHAGQVALPGGRVDPEDAGPVAAALREAEEEIGLPRDAVEVVGTSDMFRIGSGFEIVPVVGVVPPDLPLVPHEAEVEAVFEVPLAFLRDPANRIRREAEFQGRPRRYYEIQWRERRIWGATAAILINFARRLGTWT